MTEFAWVRHKGTGGVGQVPVGVLDDMAEKGWEPCDPPEPVDPTTADALAWRQASAAAAETKPTKSAARGKSTEGVSSDG